jgi:cation transport ATPase
VNIQAKVGGTIKAPSIKTDLKQTANSLAQDLKQQATAFVQNKIDSTKAAVTAHVNNTVTAIKDTVKAVKQQVVNDVKNEAIKQIFKTGDTTQTADPKKKVEEAGKNILKNLNPFKKG